MFFGKQMFISKKNLAQSPRCRRKLGQIFIRLTQSALHELNKGQVTGGGAQNCFENFAIHAAFYRKKKQRDKRKNKTSS